MFFVVSTLDEMILKKVERKKSIDLTLRFGQ